MVAGSHLGGSFVVFLIRLGAGWLGPSSAGRWAGPVADREPDQTYDQAEEDFVRTPPGFDKPGERRQARGANSARLRVKVVDDATGELATCRVNVVGPAGHFYEPADHPLEVLSAHRIGCHVNEETHPPSRYYGWHFYSTGQFEVDVPAGEVRVEVWKGYEFEPVAKTVQVVAASQPSVEIRLQRTVPMHELGYYSGDSHIHLNRRNEDDDRLALDLLAAEDIRYGYILCMNDPRHYSGRMDRQEWPQERGFGPNSVRKRGIYGIASAQEYRSKEYGHICLLMHDRLVLEGVTTDPNRWPVFGVVGEMTRRQGGYSFHAHGGYEREIYADYVQQATDGVELLQMAHYRGIGLRGWYRILNIGYRFPALAGSDAPYTRAPGDCRTYVHAKSPPSFTDWARLAAEGRSFFTTGPMLLLEVDGRRPGDTIDLPSIAPRPVTARLRVRCNVTPVHHLELIVSGTVAQRWSIPRGANNVGHWHEHEYELEIDKPVWIAARAYSTSRTGKSDAEAHTNPVYVHVGGKRPFIQSDVAWLVKQLDGQIKELDQRSFPEKEQALEFFQESRKRLLELAP